MALNNIKKALQALGVTGAASIRYACADCVIVNFNGEYFGIWDAEKNTFVD